MKKVVLVFCMFFGLNQVVAQSKFNRLSIEASGGAAVPLSPNNLNRSDYVGLNSFQISGRYNFDSKSSKNLKDLSVQLSYTRHSFRNKNNSDLGIDFDKFTVEAVYNIGQRLGFGYRFYERFGLLAHTGLGMSFGTPVGANFYERIGHLQLGITPQVKISERFAFFADATYVVNLKQHYGYNGSLISNSGHKTGGFATLSVGIMFYPGSNKYHADWY